MEEYITQPEQEDLSIDISLRFHKTKTQHLKSRPRRILSIAQNITHEVSYSLQLLTETY